MFFFDKFYVIFLKTICAGGGDGFFIKLKLTDINKEFFTTKVWTKKNHAENEAAIQAVRYLEKIAESSTSEETSEQN